MSDKHFPFDPAKVTLREFKLVKGQIDTPEFFDHNRVKGFGTSSKLKLGFNLKDNLARADFYIDVNSDSKGKNQEEATAHFHLVFIYHIEELDAWITPLKGKHIKAEAALGNALSAVTYSTSRGILLSRLQGTALQQFILPIINPNSLLQTEKT